MRRLLLSFALLLWSAVQAQAAISVVQTFTGRADDVTITYTSPLSAGTHVVVAVIVNSKTNTVTLADLTTTPVTLFGPADHATENLRGYVFCFPSEAGDTDFQAVTTPGSGAALVAGAEISGGSCTQDGSGASQDSTLTNHDIGTPTSTTVTGSFVIGAIESSSTSNFTVETGTGIGSGGVATADIAGGDNVGVGLGQYIIAGAPGSVPFKFDSAANELTLIVMAAVQPAAVSTGGMLLRGIGEDQ